MSATDAFVVLIPARLASTRLPDKPLADIAGKPMIVRVVEQAARSAAARVVVATDSAAIEAAVRRHGHEVVMTRNDHASGTDRLAEAAALLALGDDAIVVNVQGDEPEMPPGLIDAVAARLVADPGCAIATAAHRIDRVEDWLSVNVVKVVLDRAGRALYFSRAPIPFPRDALKSLQLALPAARDAPNTAMLGPPTTATLERACQAAAPLRHIGLYAYRGAFLKTYARMPASPLEDIEALEQLRALCNGFSIAVEIATDAPQAGIDTVADLAAARARFRL